MVRNGIIDQDHVMASIAVKTTNFSSLTPHHDDLRCSRIGRGRNERVRNVANAFFITIASKL